MKRKRRWFRLTLVEVLGFVTFVYLLATSIALDRYKRSLGVSAAVVAQLRRTGSVNEYLGAYGRLSTYIAGGLTLFALVYLFRYFRSLFLQRRWLILAVLSVFLVYSALVTTVFHPDSTTRLFGVLARYALVLGIGGFFLHAVQYGEAKTGAFLVLLAYLAYVIYVAVFVIGDSWSDFGFLGDRFALGFEAPTSVAMTSLAIVFIAVLIPLPGRTVRIIKYVLVLGGSAIMIVTFSRGPIIVALAALGLWLSWQKKRRAIGWLVAFVLMVGLIAGISYVGTRSRPGAGITSHRIENWRDVVHVAGETPEATLVGVDSDRVPAPHNSVLGTLSLFGLIPAVCHLLFQLITIAKLSRTRRRMLGLIPGSLLLAIAVGLGLEGLVENAFFLNDNLAPYLYYAILAGAWLTPRKEERAPGDAISPLPSPARAA